MSRKPNKTQKGQAVAVKVILPGDLVAMVDRRGEQLASEAPGSTVTRSDVIRMAVYAYVGGK